MTKIITRKRLKEKLDIKEPMTIIEVLVQKYFDAEHLPRALNIAHDEIQARASDMLLNKGEFIAVYCASTECQNSKIAADTLQLMGYPNVFEYVQGKQHWLEAKFPVETTK